MFERQKYWDACAGVMVMWMITYHIFISAEIENCIQYTLFNIFYFFMPWFFFKAGVFWRKKPINVVIRNGLKRLGIPFVVIAFWGHLIWCIQIWLQGDTNWTHYLLSPFKALLNSGTVAGALPLWFLFSLFFVRLIYTVLRCYIKSTLIILCSSLLLCYLLHIFQVSNPIWLANISSGLFFYTLGHKLPAIMHKHDSKYYLLSALLGYLLIAILYPSWVLMHNNQLVRGWWIFWVIYSCCGILVFNYIGEKWLCKISFLCTIGRNSMGLYISHPIVLNVMMLLNQYLFRFEGLHLFLMLIVGHIVLLPLINKCLRYWKIV
ncbi:acyltransferase family protein [Bacteroides congonensis]|uniref:acyltransferase family protein n=1 Tax=Bacteroides congonensis TaxID=1871006 RepID=UPI00374333D1